MIKGEIVERKLVKESGQATVEGTMAIVVLLGLLVVCAQMLLWGVSHYIAYTAAEEGARLHARGASVAQVNAKIDQWVPSFWDAAPRASWGSDTVTVFLRTPGPAANLLDDVSYTAQVVGEETR